MNAVPQQPEHSFLRATSSVLQTQQGYFPAAVAAPELDSTLTEFDVRLVQFNSHDEPTILLMSVLDDTGRRKLSDGELREHGLAVITDALSAFGPESRVRVSVVFISDEALSSRDARRALRRARIKSQPRREVGFHLVVPRLKRFQSGHRFLSFASNNALNPCNPEPNIFTRLLRRGWDTVGTEPAPDRQVRRFMEERSFSEKLLTRPAAVWGLLLVNLVIWYLTECLGGSRDIDVLTRCGAKVNGLIQLGQYWRLVTPTFLHAGYAHMFINGLALLVLGQTLERLYGSVRFVLAYFLCGIAAALASLMVNPGVMVGASGAIFGIIGMLVTYGFRHRRDIPPRFQAMFGAGLLPLVGLNLLLGFLIPQIDNAAHIGGLIAGGLLGLALCPRTAAQPGRVAHMVRRIVFVAVGVVVLVSTAFAVRFVLTYPNAVAVDARFVLEHQLGSARLSVPATWTVVQHAPGSWRLSASYVRAEVEILVSERTTETAISRCVGHYSVSPGGLKVPTALLAQTIVPLVDVGRARLAFVVGNRPVFPRLTYIILPEGLGELAVTPTGSAAPTDAGLVRVLQRLEESFVPTAPATPAESP